MNPMLGGIFFCIGAIAFLIGGFVFGLGIWKKEGYLSLWHIKLLGKCISSLFHLDIIGCIKYYGLWLITCIYGIFSYAPFILMALASGGSNTRRTSNYSDNTTTYIAQGQADAMNGASPLHPDNPQYMSAYNDYKNNH